MESLELIARENEFKKLNKQLEKRTENLMKEIENVMHKPDFFTEISQKLSLGLTNNSKIHCRSEIIKTTEKNVQNKNNKKGTQKLSKPINTYSEPRNGFEDNSKFENGIQKQGEIENLTCVCCKMEENKNVDNNFLYAFVSVNVQEKVLPQSFVKERVTVENVCKFLSSKIKLLQEQINKLQLTIDKKAAQCEKHLTHQAELESERMSLLSKANSMKTCAADTKAKCMSLEKRLHEKDNLYKELRSESDKLTVDVKRLKVKNANVEARFASQEETINNLKHQLETARIAEKDFKDSTRSLSASHESAIAHLEGKVKSQNATIHKQMALISNLKQQNALLIADGAVKALEKDFNQFLAKDF